MTDEVKRVVGFILALLMLLTGVGGVYSRLRQNKLNQELCLAVQQNDLPGMQRAVARGADVNAWIEFPWPLRNYSFSVLSEAVRLRNQTAAEYLLRCGADPRAKGRWFTPVLTMAHRDENRRSRKVLVDLLKRYGAGASVR